MSDVTPTPEDFEDDHFPVRGNDWLANRFGEIAQVKAVYAARDFSGDREHRRFFVDLAFYESSGFKIGRKSVNPPSMIAGKMRRGPRAFDPFCSLEGWYRIEPPQFPLDREMVEYPDPEDPTKVRLSFEWTIKPKAWGNYAKRKRVPAVIPAAPSRSNYDPELEKRALLLTAQNLRDIARETGNEELRTRAQELEKQADELG